MVLVGTSRHHTAIRNTLNYLKVINLPFTKVRDTPSLFSNVMMNSIRVLSTFASIGPKYFVQFRIIANCQSTKQIN